MSNYKVPKIKELLDAGVHFGHQVRRWHPKMEKYIFSVKNDVHIIDLEKTEEALKNACEYLFKIASEGGQIIFVGTKRQAGEVVLAEAQRSGALYVSQRWLGGTITNLPEIKRSVDKYLLLLKRKEQDGFKMYTKKERLLIDRKIEKLKASVGGLVGIKGTPSALFVIDAKREKTAISEANSYGAGVVALVDTNTNPEGITHVIPGNDDAIKAIVVITKAIADAVEAGYKIYSEKLAKETKVEKKAEEKKKDVPSQETPLKVSMTESSVVTEVAGKKAIKDVQSNEGNNEEVLNSNKEGQ